MVYRYSDKDGTPNKLLDRTLPMVVERGKSVGWHVLHFPVRAPIMLYALYTPFIHPLYTLIAAYAPMCTRYTCIYTIYIHLTRLLTPYIHPIYTTT